VVWGMMKSVRSLQSYFDVHLALRSESVKKSSKFALDKFSIFLKDFHQTSPDKIISDFADQELALDTLQEFVNWYSRTKTQQGEKPNARTVIQTFHNVKRYLHYMGIKFHPLDVKQNITFPQILEEEKHGVTREEIIKILENVSFRKKALYMAQLSSGMRIGELCQLRKKHLDITKKRIMVKIPASFTKTGRARTTFFSKEFDELFRFKINEMKDDDLLFATNPRVRGAVDNEIQNMDYVCKKIGLKNVTTHSFRAYFITKVARLDYNLSKLYTGQKGYLLQYDRLNDEEKLEKYLEFEPELYIYENKVQKKEIEKLTEELDVTKKKLTYMITRKDFKETLKGMMYLFMENQSTRPDKKPVSIEELEKIMKDPKFLDNIDEEWLKEK